MMASPRTTSILRFGLFELDLRTSELRKKGVKIKLQEQPFQVLVMLRSLKKAAEERDVRLCWVRVLPAEYLQGPRDSLIKLRLKKAILKLIISRILARHRIIATAHS